MAKKLRVRDRVLLGMAILGDLYFEVFEPVSVQLKKMKGFLPPDYKASNFTINVSRMLKTGCIEKVIKNGQPYFRLSGVGKKALARDFSIFNESRRKWDGLWRIVFYDIPENEKIIRNRLHGKLTELGFGMLQESVYITPFDVAEDFREFLTASNLSESVFVGVVKQLMAGDVKLLAQRIWKLEELNDKYWNLSQKIQRDEALSKIFTEFQDLLRLDPCLPKELLPNNWLGRKVSAQVKNLLSRQAS